MESVDAVVTWTDVVTVVLVGLQLGVLAVAAFVALRHLREARRTREAEHRPFVIVDLEVENFIFSVAVSNIGTMLARDVEITIEPRLRSSIADTDLSKIKMLAGIPSLAPGRSLRSFIDTAMSRHGSDLPDSHEVRVRYAGESDRRFDERMVLDFGLYWETLSITRHGIHDVHAELTKIAKLLASWNASGHGLRVMTPDDERRWLEETRRRMGERRKQPEEQVAASGETPTEPSPDEEPGVV